MPGQTNQPTPEQVQKFWEWCGWRTIKRSFLHYSPEQIASPKSLSLEYAVTSFPPIDLNSLFKWAVPKVEEIYCFSLELLDNGTGTFRVAIYQHVFDSKIWFGHNTDPALALFWAIWQVMESEDAR